jgi:O-acetyl-ADP-ribose deacetylase (regulator of RNase III)
MTTITAILADITTVEVDAVVNAANSRLVGGGGVDGAIHRAGGPTILEECRRWVSSHGHLPTGHAMATGAGRLPARFVIHTVGPVWPDHEEESARRLLAACYRNSLELASSLGCRSVAFPNISTGVYRFPKQLAAKTALDAVRDWVGENRGLDSIVFVCFDEENLSRYESLLDSSDGGS